LSTLLGLGSAVVEPPAFHDTEVFDPGQMESDNLGKLASPRYVRGGRIRDSKTEDIEVWASAPHYCSLINKSKAQAGAAR
jgi:hypothetical protein